MESKIELFEHQKLAKSKLKSGSVLRGGVGSGKTLTGLSFYQDTYPNRKLYIITTAKKRDTGDWQAEAALLNLHDIVVDSWNNVKNYTKIKNAFFIFDEQRVVGSGSWASSFIKISQKNKWLLLTATPGDTWMEYMSVFIAHGFYKNKSEFIDRHVEYNPYVKFPSIRRYHNEGELIRYRNSILVHMPMKRHTLRTRKYVQTSYDEDTYHLALHERWNPYTEQPILNASELTHVLRRIVATSDGRIHEAAWQLIHLKKVIVFYNYNYELEILEDLCEFLNLNYSQWNGKKHQEIPKTDEWVYLVQYTAGAEGWECIETNKILFYSANYSYKIVEQAEGRIDRLNTKYIDLYYTYLTSESNIDKAVLNAISNKKTFNERAWVDRIGKS